MLNFIFRQIVEISVIVALMGILVEMIGRAL
jgi:hypothetical protein